EVEVEDELFGAAAGGEARDGDEAAFLRRQVWTGPHLSEEDVVSEGDQRGGEVAEHSLGARWFLVVVSHGLFPPESVAGAGGGYGTEIGSSRRHLDVAVLELPDHGGTGDEHRG